MLQLYALPLGVRIVFCSFSLAKVGGRRSKKFLGKI